MRKNIVLIVFITAFVLFGADKDDIVDLQTKAASGDANAMCELGRYYRNGMHGMVKDERMASHWTLKAASNGCIRAVGLCCEFGYGTASNATEAIRWYKKAAEKGDIDAMRMVGRCFAFGEGVAKDKSKAFEWYKKAAEKGDAGAMVTTGHCFAFGEGVAVDKCKAFEWYMKAAEKGNVDAMVNAGLCYEIGKGVTEDKCKAFDWYKKAAEKGDASAVGLVGACYEFGKGVAVDKCKAFDWYKKAAEKGNAYAMMRMGICYENGEGVAKDKSKAFELYKKAAEKGYDDAMVSAGLCYEIGKGVAVDKCKAFDWYKKAAEKGNANAMMKMGICYECGIGVAEDKLQAFEWYIKHKKTITTDAENGSSYAMRALATIYHVSRDYQMEIKWLKKAMVRNDVDAELRLARINLQQQIYKSKVIAEPSSKREEHACRVRTRKDPDATSVSRPDFATCASAINMFRDAVNKGCTEAMYELGKCYLNGIGVDKDNTKALEMLRSAAEKGNVSSISMLGEIYFNGIGVTKDVQKAAEFCHKAARSGEERSMLLLSKMYAKGIGASKNVDNAKEWYEKGDKIRCDRERSEMIESCPVERICGFPFGGAYQYVMCDLFDITKPIRYKGLKITGYLQKPFRLFDKAEIEAWNGFIMKVRLFMSNGYPPGVDAAEEIEKVEHLFEKKFCKKFQWGERAPMALAMVGNIKNECFAKAIGGGSMDNAFKQGAKAAEWDNLQSEFEKLDKEEGKTRYLDASNLNISHTLRLKKNGSILIEQGDLSKKYRKLLSDQQKRHDKEMLELSNVSLDDNSGADVL